MSKMQVRVINTFTTPELVSVFNHAKILPMVRKNVQDALIKALNKNLMDGIVAQKEYASMSILALPPKGVINHENADMKALMNLFAFIAVFPNKSVYDLMCEVCYDERLMQYNGGYAKSTKEAFLNYMNDWTKDIQNGVVKQPYTVSELEAMIAEKSERNRGVYASLKGVLTLYRNNKDLQSAVKDDYLTSSMVWSGGPNQDGFNCYYSMMLLPLQEFAPRFLDWLTNSNSKHSIPKRSEMKSLYRKTALNVADAFLSDEEKKHPYFDKLQNSIAMFGIIPQKYKPVYGCAKESINVLDADDIVIGIDKENKLHISTTWKLDFMATPSTMLHYHEKNSNLEITSDNQVVITEMVRDAIIKSYDDYLQQIGWSEMEAQNMDNYRMTGTKSNLVIRLYKDEQNYLDLLDLDTKIRIGEISSRFSGNKADITRQYAPTPHIRIDNAYWEQVKEERVTY